MSDDLKDAIKTVIDAGLVVQTEESYSIFRNGDLYMEQRPDGGCYESDFETIYRHWRNFVRST